MSSTKSTNPIPMKESKTIERVIRIGNTPYHCVYAPSRGCQDCDIFKDSGITAPHQYPLCYTHTTQGKEANGTRGLVVNWCSRHLDYIWKKD